MKRFILGVLVPIQVLAAGRLAAGRLAACELVHR